MQENLEMILLQDWARFLDWWSSASFQNLCWSPVFFSIVWWFLRWCVFIIYWLLVKSSMWNDCWISIFNLSLCFISAKMNCVCLFATSCFLETGPTNLAFFSTCYNVLLDFLQHFHMLFLQITKLIFLTLGVMFLLMHSNINPPSTSSL